MSSIRIDHVTKSFGENVILKDFTASFEDGKFVTLLGASGCGKTTMLRMIAGFEKPDEGEIYIDDTMVSGTDVFIPPEKRGIGMVFQSYAVWPHMNVFDNVAYPLKLKKIPKDEIKRKVEETLEIVHMEEYAKRMPSELSGGQQQRVSLGRALVAEPKVLLLDEPLSNLDARLREDMRFEIKDIQQSLNMTVVYVTHDQSEAMTMSDTVYVINGGMIVQKGSPIDIYSSPEEGFVADFIGRVNLFPAEADNGRIKIDGTDRYIGYDGGLSGKIEVAIRPDDIYVISREGRFLKL
ncbi:MAG: ABC transporter ATP-binding protein [Lachnospiraceae bacterium]|nr:ABC transporter ATP-binding protein [Lachnospiraceae bacterium]